MRSMYSGVSGLRVHQTKMDVISNNISNINTIGFKRNTVSFKDSFSQTLSSASGANADKGGTNPQQVGMGANVGAIATIMGQGAAQRTDNGNDLLIDGDGFFIVQDATGFSFTRAGAFEVDAAGNLVDANGFKVCGWQAVDDPDNPGQQKVIKERVTPINIYQGDNLFSPAKATSEVEFSGNFNAATNPEQKNTISFYDSQGNKYTLDVLFKKTDTNKWEVSIPVEGPSNPAKPTDGKVAVMVNGEKMYMDPPTLGGKTTIEFDETGTVKSDPANLPNFTITGFNVDSITTDGTTNAGLGGKVNDEIKVDYSTVTQFNSKVTVTSNMKDGNTAGNMTGYSIDGNGLIRGVYSNGDTKILAQIPLANFTNPAGLEKVGNNLYKETNNSSEFDGIGSEISALGSTLQSGALEMSNVDLSYEFSEMITTQRGFQANSRIITTSDEMIQELVNLKR